jgi:hypothetical protein
MSVEVVDPKEAQKRCQEQGWKLLDVRTVEEYNRKYTYLVFTVGGAESCIYRGTSQR